jgi:predicted metalloprotease
MRLDDQRESDNVEDLRGSGFGGGGGFGFGGRSIGIGGIIIALIAAYFFGIDPSAIIGMMTGGGPEPARVTQQQRPPAAQSDDPAVHQIRRILGKTEDTWGEIFREAGRTYEQPKLVLYTGATPTACGTGQAAMGPFYCPEDRKVYLDLHFFQLMRQRFHATGEFAQAYVIAHEIGHHVQTLLGITQQMEARRARSSQRDANTMSVRIELQADCFAGVWAKRGDQQHQFLDPGDIESAINAAAAIGDDTLQRETQGRVVPDSFTHGTSAQRVTWLKRGYDSGDVRACDTFRASQL